jgi:RimJ/RimL family protein N-acetyltransferase
MIDPENEASIKVAENVGMTFEKECADEHGPFWVYSIATN